MNLVLIGPPGAGKGTHATLLSEKFSLVPLAAGDILRRHIRDQTDLGKKAKSVIEKGELVSDDLVNSIMFHEIDAVQKKGVLLDGYPRTMGQAEALDQYLSRTHAKLDAVLNFETSEEMIVGRLSGRRICAKCGANYHLRNPLLQPKKAGFCDKCGEALTQRKDDQPETIRHRLDTYKKETEPLLGYYRSKGVLHDLHGDWDVREFQEEMRVLFEKLNLTV